MPPNPVAGKENATATRALEKIRLVIGPAMDMLTISSPSGVPEIIIAPGAIILKGKNMETKVKATPQVVKRNSAHKPFFWATALCANSCVNIDTTSMAAKTAIKTQVHAKLKPPKYLPYNPMEKPMPTISAAATDRCFISLGLVVMPLSRLGLANIIGVLITVV